MEISRIVPQAHFSMECWGIQLEGLSRCDHCEYRGTHECGGKKIRKTGKNNLGFEVPLGEPHPHDNEEGKTK